MRSAFLITKQFIVTTKELEALEQIGIKKETSIQAKVIEELIACNLLQSIKKPWSQHIAVSFSTVLPENKEVWTVVIGMDDWKISMPRELVEECCAILSSRSTGWQIFIGD